MTQLPTFPRNATDKPDALRAAGQIPAVMYGAGVETTNLAIPKDAFTRAWKEAGESTVVTLEGSFGKQQVLIHDVQYDARTSNAIHIDFLAVDAKHAVTVSVPLTFIDEAPGIKAGGALEKLSHEVEIEALPGDLPHELTVSLLSLTDIGTHIYAKDIKLPKGVTLVTSGDEVVALISAPHEEPEESSEPIDLSSIEVEKKGKKEETEDAE
jgi:large subunit ribosomal protein L25